MKALYAVDFSGGQVDITAGTFVFSASEAYWVKNGKIAYPVKGATIIGNGPAVMQRISAVGSDFALDSGIGNMWQRWSICTCRGRSTGFKGRFDDDWWFWRRIT